MACDPSFVIVNIDDNDMNLLLIETYLSGIDATFVNFTKPVDAVEYILNNPCDMVIVDYHMPLMDGTQLTKEIKKIDPEIPVIMVTASDANDSIQIKALSAGVNDFIKKPINKAILVNRVKNFMKLRRSISYLANQEKLLQHQVDKATKELQQTVHDLQIAQQITHFGSWTWDIMEGHLHWSDETYRIFGLQPQSVPATYEKFLQFVHPDDRTKLQEAVDHAIYHQTSYTVQHRIIVGNKVKYVHERGNAYYNDNNEPTYMIGTVYDTTEMTEAYLSLVQKEQETLRVLSRTAEYKDEETANHIKRVSAYTVLIAKHLNLSPEEQDILYFAAPLHDIGKVGTPDHILLKPGRLDEEEMTIMRDHAMIGANILEDVTSPYLKAGHIIALSHHEKYDGSGYPKGLKGDDIPLYGRIVAIADVFDALTSRRPYKKAWPFDEAMEFLKDNAGSHFDPVLIKIFIENTQEVHTIYTQYED
ncbi:MAG TPA: HD domain-containing phosphohydrolase [Sulfuricurvum sp.]|nr:HD domain-containing phosphohydrolase [Sulfuricurvum sp.]